ncbi:FIG00731743: hypothetical protein [Klebsiella pneumoniae ISC21]|nr:FIG00731743: hypothetical protein [Klebsiella pneumoniae ISC21]
MSRETINNQGFSPAPLTRILLPFHILISAGGATDRLRPIFLL